MESKDQIQKVKTSNDIVEVISLYLSLQKSGKSYRGLCPFHQEKTPSFHVYSNSQSYYCFGCGSTGDVIRFIQEIEKLSFMDALRKLADRVNIRLAHQTKEDPALTEQTQFYRDFFRFYHQALKKDQRALQYLINERQLSMHTLGELSIGYIPEGAYFGKSLPFSRPMLDKYHLVNPDGKLRFHGRIIFPIQDGFGRIIGIAGRSLSDAEGVQKYLNSSETPYFKKSWVLFLEHKAKSYIKEHGFAIVVEGYMDALALYANGFQNTVAVMGTHLSATHIRKLRSYTEKLLLIFDNDEAGERALHKSFFSIPQKMSVAVADLEEAKDPDEYLRRFGTQAFRSQVAKAKPLEESLLNHVASQFDLSKPNGKDGFLSTAKPIVEHLHHPVSVARFDAALKQISRQLDIPLDQIRLWATSSPHKTIAFKKPESGPKPQKTNSVIDAELQILMVFLLHPSKRDEIKKQIRSLEGFLSEGTARFLREAGDRFPPEEATHHFKNYFASDFLEKLFAMQRHTDVSAFPDKVLEDCVYKIELKKINQKIQEIDQELRHTDDSARKSKLLEDRMALSKKKGDIRMKGGLPIE